MGHQPSSGARGRRGQLTAAAAVLAVLAVSLVGKALADQVGDPPAPPAAVSAPPGATSGTASGHPPAGVASGRAPGAMSVPTSTAPAVAPLPPSPPVRVQVPRIGLDTRDVVGLGRQHDGAMAVPRGPGPVGWFTGAPTPGALGPAVLAAHVTWNGAKGAFFAIGSLRPGDEVAVTRRDGRVAHFSVTAVRTYRKDAFPTGDVYGNLDHAGLRLITCAGDYDPARHHYPDNVVVFADLTSVTH